MKPSWDETIACADCGDPGAYWYRGRMLCDDCWEEAMDGDCIPGSQRGGE
jgi:hypothetical protein